MKSETETTNPTIVAPATPVAHLTRFFPGASRAIAGDLLLIFGIALAVRFVWALVLPPWQAIDETEHFSYVNHIAEQGSLPPHIAIPSYPDYSLELQDSLENTSFYPLVRDSANTVALIPVLDPAAYATARQFAANGSARYDSGRSRATSYPPLYYLLLSVPDRLLHAAPITSRMFAMRVVSGLFGALTCLFAYLTAYDVFRSRRWGWYVGLCAAFMASFAHVSTSVNNDTLMNLFAAILIWCAVRVVLRRHLSLGLIAGAIVWSALLIETKPTALPVIGIVALVYVGVLWVQWWRQTRRSHFRLAPPITLGVIAALVPIIWFVAERNTAIGGFPILRFVANNLGYPSPPRYSLLDYFHALVSPRGMGTLLQFFWSFWGWLGWGFATLPVAVLYATIPLSLVGIVGFVLRTIGRPAERPIWFLFLAFILGQFVFLYIGVEYRLAFSSAGQFFGLTGRYLYPDLIPILLVFVAGWAYLFRDSSRALRGITIAMFALQLICLSVILTRYFDVMIGWVQ